MQYFIHNHARYAAGWCGTKNIKNQFATSVMQEHIVPSAVNASITNVVDERKKIAVPVSPDVAEYGKKKKEGWDILQGL